MIDGEEYEVACLTATEIRSRMGLPLPETQTVSQLSITEIENNFDFLKKQLADHLDGKELRSTAEHRRLKEIMEKL